MKPTAKYGRRWRNSVYSTAMLEVYVYDTDNSVAEQRCKLTYTCTLSVYSTAMLEVYEYDTDNSVAEQRCKLTYTCTLLCVC